MAKVKDTTATPAEALTFDGLFLNDLHMSQVKIKNDSDDPQYGVSVTYRRYAVDSSGVRHYKEEAKTIEISDFFSAAAAASASGKPGRANALQGIIEAFADEVADAEGVSVAIL